MTKRKTKPEPTVVAVTTVKEGQNWVAYQFRLPESVAIKYASDHTPGDMRAMAQTKAMAWLDEYIEGQIV